MNVVDVAETVALSAHNGQINKHDGEPYILHVHRVFMAVRDRGLSETHRAVAWLHDVVEDTEVTFEYLSKIFFLEPEILAAVNVLTKTKGEANVDYYHVLATNPIAAAVKISDIHDNFSRNHFIEDEQTRLRMSFKYSMGLDILKEFV